MAAGEPTGEVDPSDPERSGHSLTNLWELLEGCLEAAEARSVVEIGAFAGDLTKRLLAWAEPSGAHITAVDPFAHPWLMELVAERPELDHVAEPSHEALAHLPVPDAVIVDGDHNYYTVSEELRIISERAGRSGLPLCLFHDVTWPHGRRDAYWNPDVIPAGHRHPLSPHPTLFPGNAATAEEGLVLPASAAHEGGPRNGVLTAIEDFAAPRPDLAMAVVPAFFGFAAVWPKDALWAGAVADVLAPWDANPLVERLEANRTFNVATSSARAARISELERAAAASREQISKLGAERDEARRELEAVRSLDRSKEKVLRALLDAGGLRLADRLSALRHPGRDWSWAERIRSVLSDKAPLAARRRMTEPPGNLTAPKAWKNDAIEFAFREVGARSFADLGSIGVVYGQYAFHAASLPGVERGVMVDDYIPGLKHPWVQERANALGIEVIHGNFADPAMTDTVGEVDAIFLFEVLLHAAAPNWDELIAMWAPMTRSFVVANPQWNGTRTERLIELGRERYLEVVPESSNHAALFDRLDEVVPHLGKPWRDAHHVWQWGITDTSLADTMAGHGFTLLRADDHGPFLGNSQHFDNKTFVFAKT